MQRVKSFPVCVYTCAQDDTGSPMLLENAERFGLVVANTLNSTSNDTEVVLSRENIGQWSRTVLIN